MLVNGSVNATNAGQNSVYVYKSSDSTDAWSYIIRTTTAPTNCDNVASWISTTAYVGGDMVLYNGKYYKTRWWTQGNIPSENVGVDGSGKVWAETTCSGSTPSPSPTPTTSPSPAPYPDYKEGTKYKAGDKVVASDKHVYTCKPWPYTNWCSGAAWAYAPATGLYWNNAWTQDPHQH